MNKLLFIWILALTPCAISAQTIKGKVTDEEGNAISGVHLIFRGTQTGAISDSAGNYTVLPCGNCQFLIISHVRYKKTVIELSDLKKNPNITLFEFSHDIPAVDIYSKPVIALLPDTPLFINDYEVIDDRIWLCAFTNRSIGKPNLLYTDLYGNILDSEPLSTTGDLYVDPEKSVYLIQKEFAYELLTENDEFFWSEPFESSYVMHAREHWTHSLGDSIILKYYYYKNQGLAYYIRILPEDSARLWMEFIDEEAYDRMSWGGFFDGNEFDQRFEDLVVYKPVQIPVFVRGDSIVAFNFILHKIQMMDHKGTIGREIPMTFGSNNHLKEEIYYDQYSDRYYGREVKNGVNRLIEIDLESGGMIQSYTFKGYPHIEKLIVSKGVLYFLYKDYCGDEYKRLYKSPLIRMTAG